MKWKSNPLEFKSSSAHLNQKKKLKSSLKYLKMTWQLDFVGKILQYSGLNSWKKITFDERS